MDRSFCEYYVNDLHTRPCSGVLGLRTAQVSPVGDSNLGWIWGVGNKASVLGFGSSTEEELVRYVLDLRC